MNCNLYQQLPRRLILSKTLFPFLHRLNCSLDIRYYCDNESSTFEQKVQVSSPYLINNYHDITDGDAVKLKILKHCQLEVDLLYQEGKCVPLKLKSHQWYELMNTESKEERIKYLKCLRFMEDQKETKEKNKKLKRLFLKCDKKTSIQISTGGPIIYNLKYNTLFYRISRIQINSCLNFKLLQAFIFSPKIVIDMSYENKMSVRELTSCSRQIFTAWINNRQNFEPFGIHFCNVSEKSVLTSKLSKIIPNLYDIDFPFFYTSDSYLDIYRNEKIIYLTPDSNNELCTFDSDTIYILGAVIESGKIIPYSLEKANKEKIQTAKFPIRKYMHSYRRSNILTLKQCINTLYYLQNGFTMKYALKIAVKTAGKVKEYGNSNITTNQWIKIDCNSTVPKMNRYLINEYLLRKMKTNINLK